MLSGQARKLTTDPSPPLGWEVLPEVFELGALFGLSFGLLFELVSLFPEVTELTAFEPSAETELKASETDDVGFDDIYHMIVMIDAATAITNIVVSNVITLFFILIPL
jgi:hypothetical protein